MSDLPAEPRRPPRGHGVMVALATLYLMGVWLEGVGSGVPGAILPRTPLYFLQIAALFPHAAVNVIDYRAEAWLCKERRWQELDTRAYFPLDPDDKENRFQRVMHFLRDNRPTMNALDDYIVSGHAATDHDDGIPHDVAIGGIRVLSLRLPLPPPGAHVERTQHRPLADYGENERKNWYWTKSSKRAERCGYRETPETKEDEARLPRSSPKAADGGAPK